MNVDHAITGRRSVRNYSSKKVDDASIHKMLCAAVQAPTAIDEEPWAFIVVQDKNLLNRLSEDAKRRLNNGTDPIHVSGISHLDDHLVKPEFNTFYNATTLIVIYGKPVGYFVAADCWLAAQNLILSAYAQGLGSCVIGLAVTVLNSPEWKVELGISENMTAFVPIIIGTPFGVSPHVVHKPPEILTWRR